MTHLHQLDIPIRDMRSLPALSKLQGNILKSHGRDHVVLLFVRFTGTETAVKRWLREQSDTITSAADQLASSARLRGLGIAGALVKTISLSWAGYQYLGFDDASAFVERLPSMESVSPLRSGMLERLEAIGDRGAEDWESSYLQGRKETTIHALVSLADSEWQRLADARQALEREAAGVVELVTREEGHQLKRDGNPIEHFGYRDGISQPRFFQYEVDEELDPARSRWDPSAGPSLVLVHDPFAPDPEASGSYLVFRKLEQNVTLFREMETRLAELLGATTDADRRRIESMVVGRSPEGDPLVKASGIGINDFTYQDDLTFPFTCPMHAHARKANPRRDSAVKDEFRERRIARRSITYGVDPNALTAVRGDAEKKGVLFMCYQRSIASQFEFVQRFWLRSVGFPMSGSGPDVFTGAFSPEQRWNLTGQPQRTLEGPAREVVTVRGGAYLFTPSLVFLRAL